MSIATNSIITWSEFSTTCLTAIKAKCCNIGNFASDVPARIKSGQGQVTVQTQTRSRPSGQSGGTIQTSYYYANPSNLVSTVTEATVNSEWNTFLSAAGINARSDKVIQARDLSLAISLYMQFMSYHLKPIYTRLQIYNTVDGARSAPYEGTKYVSGTCTPDYTLSGVNPGSIPDITNANIQDMVAKAFQVNRLFTRYDNAATYRSYLS